MDRAQLAFEPVDLLGDEVRFELSGTPADADSRPAVAVGRDAQLCTVFQTAEMCIRDSINVLNPISAEISADMVWIK